MRNFFNIISTVALDLIYPRHCAACGAVIGGITDIALCRKCAQKTYTPKVVRSDKYAFDEAIAMMRYEGNARDAMIRYKFKSIRYYAKAYAYIMKQSS